MTATAIRSRPLVAFFVLAFGLTWAVWVPRAAGVEVGAVGQLWTWAPAAAALLAAALTGGRAAVAELGSRLVRWRVGWRWYAVVVLGPAAFSLSVAALYALLGGSWAEAAPPLLSGETSLVLLPVFLAGLLLTDGLGEEVGLGGGARAASRGSGQRTRPRYRSPWRRRARRPSPRGRATPSVWTLPAGGGPAGVCGAGGGGGPARRGGR